MLGVEGARGDQFTNSEFEGSKLGKILLLYSVITNLRIPCLIRPLSSAMHLGLHSAGASLTQWHPFSSTGWKKQHVTRRDRQSFKSESDLVAAVRKSRKEEAENETTEEMPAAKKRPKAKNMKGSEAKDEEVALPAKPAAQAQAASIPFDAASILFDAASVVQNCPPTESIWYTPRYWVCFTDLHLSSKTSTTCIEVLQRVHKEAVSRQAGIVFLGDFWDERGRS